MLLFTLTPFTTRVLAIVTLPDEIRLRSIHGDIRRRGDPDPVAANGNPGRSTIDWMTIAAESSELMVYRRNTSAMNIPCSNSMDAAVFGFDMDSDSKSLRCAVGRVNPADIPSWIGKPPGSRQRPWKSPVYQPADAAGRRLFRIDPGDGAGLWRYFRPDHTERPGRDHDFKVERIPPRPSVKSGDQSRSCR